MKCLKTDECLIWIAIAQLASSVASASVHYVLDLGGPLSLWFTICLRHQHCIMQVWWGSEHITSVEQILDPPHTSDQTSLMCLE